MREIVLFGLALLSGVASSFAAGGNVSVETVLSGLHQPGSIAVRPGGMADRYELFIAENGSGRVVRWSNRAREKTVEAIAGFEAGKLSLLFLDPSLLAVGCSSADGSGLLRVFELTEDGSSQTAAGAHQTRGLDSMDNSSPPSSTPPANQPASCYALTRSRPNEHVNDMLVMAVRGGDGQSALYRSRLQAGILAPLQPFAAAGQPTEGSIATVATSSSGRIVAVYQRGREQGVAFAYLNPIDRSTELEYTVEGPEVTALAYSPITGCLYAVTTDGGISRVECEQESAGQQCRLIEVTKIPGATAMAFAPDGDLYVTTSGEGAADGTLRVLTGSL